MRKINVSVVMGLQGCEVNDEIEVEDDSTPDEIEEQVREWALEHVEWWHEEAEGAGIRASTEDV